MPPPTAPEAQFQALRANAADLIRGEELLAKLERSVREDRPLRVKLGIDPSRPDLHLGHSVVLRKLRQFQDFGHTAVLIVGDFTGLVGDPSGQSETRPMLTPEEMEANARTYFDQAGLVLATGKAEVHGNAEWLGGLSMQEVLRLTATTTVAQMLERDDFQTRYRDGRPISVVEFLYPLMQAMDSVQIRADVELGGTDQTFNLLLGREVQRAYGQDPQVVLTMPLLEGTDGVRKMSKSLDNAVGLTEAPEEMFGKLMSIPDDLVLRYFRLLTEHEEEQLEGVQERLAAGGAKAAEAKRRLAREVVAMYHGRGAGHAAEEQFDRVHKQRDLPDDVPEATVSVQDGERMWLPAVMVASGLAASNSEARRLIEQGGVRVNGAPVTDPGQEYTVSELADAVVQVGRRRFVRLRPVSPR
jgi:tyrosyl-tRNA synthetase